jgi:DHA1 family bicyclomycin/chloramphenicol resistance-like MFS transporter
MSAPRPAAASIRQIMLLAALGSMGQFANNIYLPSLPAISAGLNASASAAQLTMTAFLIPLAAMQLVYGPLADRFGRRPLVTIGCLIFLIGCAVCALAPDIVTLIVGRALQATGAAAGVVLSRAIARDQFDGVELTRAIGLIAMFFGLAPAVAPLVGGLLQTAFDWHAAFIAAAAVGGVVLLTFRKMQPESLKTPLPRLDFAELARAYGVVLRSKAFVGYAMAGTGTLSGMFAFFSGSPFLLMEVLGLTPVEYGFLPPIGVTGFLIGGALARRFAAKATPQQLALIGLTAQWAGVICMAGLPMVGVMNAVQVSGSIALYTMGLGFLLPAVMGLAIAPFPQVAGTASATFGFLQMSGAALATVLVSVTAMMLGPLAFAWVMVGATVFTSTGLWRASHAERKCV